MPSRVSLMASRVSLYVPNTTAKSGAHIHDAIDSKRIMSSCGNRPDSCFALRYVY